MSATVIPTLICQHFFQENRNSIRAVAISPDQRTIAAAGEGEANSKRRWSLWIWDTTTGEARDVAEADDWQTHANPITSLAFSVSNQFLCAGSFDAFSARSLSCWKVYALPSHSSYNYGQGTVVVTSHPTQATFATLHRNVQFRLWQLHRGLLVQTHEWQAHTAASYSMLFSPDGRWLCSGSSTGEIKIWDAQTGKEHRSLLAHENTVRAFAFSPDGLTLVSGSDQRIKIWDFETGEVRHSFFGHPNWIRGLAITPDSQFLLSTGDAKIKIWSLETGQKLQTLVAHDAPIQAMALSQDGTLLLTGSKDGVVKVWNVQ